MSRIFKPYRGLGKVCNEVPFVLRYHPYHKEVYIVTSIGRCVHTYALQHLAIKAISDEFNEDITALTANNRYVIVATGNQLFSLKHSRSIARTFRNGNLSAIRQLLPLDDKYFISVDEKGNVIVWDVEENDPVVELQLGRLARFLTSAVLHPVSYKNKLLLGSSDGRLCLWNIRRNTMIYDFTSAIKEDIGINSNIPITCLEQGPAAHLCGIGRGDGSILILHLKTAAIMWKFKQEWGAVTTLTFRKDGVDQMLSGSSKGFVTIWRLEKNVTVGGGKEWHQDAVTGLACIFKQPLVVSSSPDNHLKVWSYSDSGPNDPDVAPRVLYRREGHSLPPTVLRYVGLQGEEILSGGRDSSLRVFSTLHERFNRHFGRGYVWTSKSASGRKKQRRSTNASSFEAESRLYPGFTDLAVESSRSHDWDTIASCHSTLPIATWNYRKGTQGMHHLKAKLFTENPAIYKNTHASCLSMSSCGNFVTVGYSSGHIFRYNIQSGLERISYIDETSIDRKAHADRVSGVCSDLLDQTIISCGKDGKVASWEAKRGKLKESVRFNSPLSLMRIHREGEAVVVGLDNGKIVLLNANTLKIVRSLSGHQYESISELAFFPDAKWLVSFGVAGTAKTWDLIHGKLIDWFQVPKPVTSAAMSPTGDFIATAHEDDLGVYLWSNQALYKPLNLTPIPVDGSIPRAINLPSSSLRSGTESVLEEVKEMDEKFLSPEQLDEQLITLSGVAESRWRHLLELDTIRERNKPVEPPKVPKQVPFFMAAVNDAGKLQMETNDKSEVYGETPDRVLLASISRMEPILEKFEALQDGTVVIQFLETLGPSAIDLEIQLLVPDEGSSHNSLINFLNAILSCIQRRVHYDTCQSYLGLLLHHHGLLCSKSELLRSKLQEIQSAIDFLSIDAQEQMDEVEVMCNLALGQLPYSE